MGGGTGNIRTLRSQSGCNGSRTFTSILSSDSGNGAGSVRRLYSWYANRQEKDKFYDLVFSIQKGQFSGRTEWFLGNV
jgi:hypothetical protein